MSNHRTKIVCASLFVLLTSSCQASFAESAEGVRSPDGTVKLEAYRRNDPVSTVEKAKRKFSKVLSMFGNLFLGMDEVTHYEHGQDSTI